MNYAMENEGRNDPVMATLIFRPDGDYSVSTIERASSAALAYGRRYNETLVWTYDRKTRERGNIVHQDEGPQGSIITHLNIRHCHQGEVPQGAQGRAGLTAIKGTEP